MTMFPRTGAEANLPPGSPADSQSPDQAGFVLVFFALALIALLGIASLVVDYGYWSLRAQQIQRAADAAALAGVAYMPNVTKATSVATTTAADNGFTSGGSVTVVVTPTDASGNTQTDQLTVKITDTGIPTFFAKVFGRDSVSETRTSTAKFDQPIPLGSPENSLGTGNLPSGSAPGSTSESAANDWLAISGYCTARENGDEFSSFYDGNDGGGGTICPNDASWPPSTVFTNVDYNPQGYVYDINDPPAANSTLTAAPVTVQIYDPSYNAPTGPCGHTTGGSNAGDNSDMPCGVTASVTTNWLIYGPGTGIFDPTVDPILAPTGASLSNPGVFGSGDTTCEDAWCSLYVIPAGSQAGNYHLNLWTTAGEPDSAATNAFALRAQTNGPSVVCQFTCPSTAVINPATDTFLPCSTIAEGTFTADPQCPEIHGDKYMGIYVDSGATSTCDPGPRQEWLSVNGQPPAATTVTGPEPCSNFYLAQVAPSYAGKTMTITLFDPGEGATAIQILQPDGTPASFTYETDDTNAEDGCPSSVAPNSCAPYVSDDGNDPPTNPVTCICDPGLQVPNLSGRVSASKYNDRYLEIQVPITTNLATLQANGGWYKVEYVFTSTVSDRTTWSVNIGGNPIHLVN
jgi:Putative Flp pilus-assembly TadE/G-like